MSNKFSATSTPALYRTGKMAWRIMTL